MQPRLKARILFGLALALVGLGGTASFFQIARLLQAQSWVTHSREVQVALARIHVVTGRAGRTRAEYIDSSDPNLRRAYTEAVASIPPAIYRLKQLTADNQSQLERISNLSGLTTRRIALMDESVDLVDKGQSSLLAQSAITRKIVEVASDMDEILQNMEDDEESLLHSRAMHLRNRERVTGLLLGSALLLAIALFILHYRTINQELEGRMRAEANSRRLSARLLQLQDEERRKFSRELHDSLGQYLVGAKMSLDMYSMGTEPGPLFADAMKLLDDALSETRTISHLLHPPLLDETGFESAASWYVEGFSKRSGIATAIEMPQPFQRLSGPTEVAMFRVMQEALTNIHKHSKSSEARILLELKQDKIHLSVRDNGRGIPQSVLDRFQNEGLPSGVGLAGMRERLHELGGTLDIDTTAGGTIIVASLPAIPRPPDPVI